MALTLRVTPEDEVIIEDLKALTGQATASGAIMFAVRDYASQIATSRGHHNNARNLYHHLQQVQGVVTQYQDSLSALLGYEFPDIKKP